MLLQDQVAVITGSSRGIGAATARLLAANGARVVVNYARNREKGEEVVAAVEKVGGEALLVGADVTRPEEVKRLVTTATDAFGAIDILVNNASIGFPMAPFVQYRWEDFERKLQGELRASFQTCQAVVPGMIDRGRGCIVNVSSALSRQPGPGFVAHSTAKAALDGFSRSLALELGCHGIRVNVVAPGLTITDATADQPEEMKQAIADHTPLGRLGTPDDVAGAVLLCCSDWARFVTGTYLPVSGGIQMV